LPQLLLLLLPLLLLRLLLHLQELHPLMCRHHHHQLPLLLLLLQKHTHCQMRINACPCTPLLPSGAESVVVCAAQQCVPSPLRVQGGWWLQAGS
jgi:hypothetical protein